MKIDVFGSGGVPRAGESDQTVVAADVSETPSKSAAQR